MSLVISVSITTNLYSIQVDIPVPMGDAYPPGGIRDLSVVMVHRNSNIVSIQMQWTAPGDELDYGIGKHFYLCKLFSNFFF